MKPLEALLSGPRKARSLKRSDLANEEDAFKSPTQYHEHAVQGHITALESPRQPDREFHHVAHHSIFLSSSADFTF
jgi:hypothetical protein